MHLIHQLNAGGMENGVVNIANHIDRSKFDLSICVFKAGGKLKAKLKPDTRVFELEKRHGNDLTLPFQIRKLIKEWRPDILHTHAWGTLIEGLLASINSGVAVKIHGEHGTIQDAPAQLTAQRFVWRFFDQVLSVSVNHKTKIADSIGFPESRIKVIDNGVDTTRFKPLSESADKDRSSQEKKQIVIGTVGRLVPVKNQQLLVNAFERIQKRHQKLQLVFIGDGPLRSELQSLTSDLKISDKVAFMGERDDIPECLRKMDIFVLPSFSEGMSNTILEAMSSGLSVVATDVGDNARLVQNNETGFITASDCIDSLEKALETLIREPDKRTAFGKNGRTRIENHFSIHSMVQNYQSLYRTLMEKHNQ